MPNLLRVVGLRRESFLCVDRKTRGLPKRACFHNAANSDELDEELVDKVKGEQGKVAGEVVLQHDAAMRSWSTSRSAREKLGGLLCFNPVCAKK